MKQTMPGIVEFIVLTAFLTSLMALAIDAMLPALSLISTDLGLADPNDAQLVISTMFLGFGVGQLLFGPLSDSMGRKPLIYWGLSIFILGCLLSMFASDFTGMLVGRFVQGLGVAAPRVITMALVRDCYSGRAMARIMSFTMIVFIMVPAVAPALGQGVLWLAGWHAIFGLFILLSLVVLVWFGLRMPETLPVGQRTAFSVNSQWQAIREVLGNRAAMAYTLVTGFIFAAFLGYLNSVQQILQIQYGLGERFPLYFAILALSIGVASFINAKLVMRLGMRLLSHYAFWLLIAVSALFLGFTLLNANQPPLWSFMLYCIVGFLGVGMLFGNLNALAMEPLGKHAGLGASVVGFLSTVVAIPIGVFIGQSYNGTVVPVVLGFLVLGVLGNLVLQWADREHPEEQPQA